MTDVERLCARIREVVSKREDVRLALLFGSRARATPHDGSDVDLAFDAPRADLHSLGATLSGALGEEVDVISLDDPTIPLLEELVRDSIVVYEARPGAGASWRSRVLAQLETDRPWYHRMRDSFLRRVATHGL